MCHCSSSGWSLLPRYTTACLILVVRHWGKFWRQTGICTQGLMLDCLDGRAGLPHGLVLDCQILDGFQGLRRCDPFVTATKQGTPIFLQHFIDDLRHRLRGVWRGVEGRDPWETNYKVAMQQALFALPFDHNVRTPIRLPGYLHLDSSQHVMLNVSRFRLRAHTLNVETASWEDGTSPVCNWCSCKQVQDEVHVLFMCGYEGVCSLRRKYFEFLQTLPGDSSHAQPFLRQQLSVQSVFGFLWQHNNKLFFFVSELLDLLLAGADQPYAGQPNSLSSWGLPM